MTRQFVTSEPGKETVVMEVQLAALPSRVFRAWMDPGVVKQWFGSPTGSLYSAHIDLREGGT